MTDLLAARAQMGISLGFHILFAVAGIAMPLLMVLAQAHYMRTGEEASDELARRWAKGTAILFAVGAVSGTVLSFELGLLWPEFMRHAGPLIGMPFSMEGFAFFLEAIFLGLYLYGRDKLPPKVHLACGVGIAVCGLASAIFVTAVNAWMNAPVGFTHAPDRTILSIDPWGPFRSPAFFTEALHMALAAYVAVAFMAMGIHAWRLRRDPEHPLHRRAFAICFGVALVATPLQLFSGDLSAKHIAEHQPVKLAAAEALFETKAPAPLAIGGWANEHDHRLVGAIEVPYALSFLAHEDFTAEVAGLDQAPESDWPPVAPVHLAFDTMVGSGTLMLAFVLWGAFGWWRRRPPWAHRRLLAIAPFVAPLGLVAIEAGWTVTELGRQPWVIHQYLRTAEAVTPMPLLQVPLFAFTTLYTLLGIVVVVMLRAHVLDADLVGRDEDGSPPR